MLKHIGYEIPLVENCPPVVMIGAGGIVEVAHLPAYQLAGIPVAGICDINYDKAAALSEKFQIPAVYHDIQEAFSNGTGCIYDIAVPGSKIIDVIRQLPDQSYALIQKPMVENLEQAESILDICRKKNITAGINFQLRYAPYILMAKQMLREGLLGDICDLEIYVNTYTPWHLWEFLKGAPRVEILYHSIHYIDLIRNLLGEPESIFAKTIRHPKTPQLQGVKSNIIMDYGDLTRVHIATNHSHDYGTARQDAFIKIEGTLGALKIKPGLLLNYPHGIDDAFEYFLPETAPTWRSLPVNGSWFPHAFIGSMLEIIQAQQGKKNLPDNSVEDCIHTMRLVEKAYAI